MPKALLEIQFTEKAVKNLQTITRSVSEFTGYASSGIRTLEELENSIIHLSMFPEMGVKANLKIRESFIITDTASFMKSSRKLC
ncbi:TPA: hypothetical protein ACK3JW_000512 [Mannheimia haemolytica]